MATRQELEKLSIKNKEVVSRLLEDICGYQISRPGSKALLRASYAFETIGHTIEKSPLAKTSINEKLYGAGLASEDVVNRRLKKATDQIIDKDDYEIIKPFTDSIQLMEDIANNEVRLVVGEKESFLEIQTS